MRPHLSTEAQSFGDGAGRAFAQAGGVDLARRAEADPTVRRREVAPMLDRLGLDDIDARIDEGTAEAAAALCRAAGGVVLPYPIVPAVLGRLALVARSGDALVDHGDLLDGGRLATLDGEAVVGSSDGTALGTRLGPFVGSLAAGGPAAVTPAEVALHLTLTGFVVVGALTAAVERATAHVVDRVQFDRPLASFQAVQFQLADAHVAVAAVEELVQFSLWRCQVAPESALPDALGARLGALDAARTVLRTCQQLHGAAGVCDEYDVSVIARHLQPALRLPFGAETSAAHLADAVVTHGFRGLFDHGGRAR